MWPKRPEADRLHYARRVAETTDDSAFLATHRRPQFSPHSRGTWSYGSRSRSRSRRVVLKSSGVVSRIWARVASTLSANILRSNFARKRTGSSPFSRALNTHLA